MKVLMLDGNLGKDAEIMKSSKGSQFVKFPLAVSVYSNGETKTEWFNIVSFEESTVKKAQYLTKGSHVFVMGTPTSSIYTAKDGSMRIDNSMYADRIDFVKVGSKNNGEGTTNTIKQSQYTEPVVSAPQPAYQAATPQPRIEEPVMTMNTPSGGDDDLPF